MISEKRTATATISTFESRIGRRVQLDVGPSTLTASSLSDLTEHAREVLPQPELRAALEAIDLARRCQLETHPNAQVRVACD